MFLVIKFLILVNLILLNSCGIITHSSSYKENIDYKKCSVPLYYHGKKSANSISIYNDKTILIYKTNLYDVPCLQFIGHSLSSLSFSLSLYSKYNAGQIKYFHLDEFNSSNFYWDFLLKKGSSIYSLDSKIHFTGPLDKLDDLEVHIVLLESPENIRFSDRPDNVEIIIEEIY